MIDLKKNYQIMGIVNTTPDSFSDGGSYTTVDVAYQHALHLLEAGADILDIGGQSTR
ncbi:MAG: dihydropteroate synthase, partial [Enterococcus faecalis]|nr:dihydropteroate synthase [Enterococcus faecalis]MDU4305289.1 dihydropteroate synthase [Enterococcus faecalis]